MHALIHTHTHTRTLTTRPNGTTRSSRARRRNSRRRRRAPKAERGRVEEEGVVRGRSEEGVGRGEGAARRSKWWVEGRRGNDERREGMQREIARCATEGKRGARGGARGARRRGTLPCTTTLETHGPGCDTQVSKGACLTKHSPHTPPCLPQRLPERTMPGDTFRPPTGRVWLSRPLTCRTSFAKWIPTK